MTHFFNTQRNRDAAWLRYINSLIDIDIASFGNCMVADDLIATPVSVRKSSEWLVVELLKHFAGGTRLL